MGDHEGWAQPSDLLPNALLPNAEVYVTRRIDNERWSLAEERTAELIARIMPNLPSEELRNAVADYVQRLIMRCISCQVFTFGSVPLKTYLPDGDIDLTAFTSNEALKDTWASEVLTMLKNEEKNENAEFRVKEVKDIQADVKLIKCLVENIVVDISFSQVGGLCTLCFLEEVDHLINQNHLFKRSIILIKAWCYYESRILGAHHGLISTYALETLVLYIFHVFNNSFSGPLEVLYRFLEFFSNFDWENYCVSLWGPVPIRALPDQTAESPRRDNGELLLKKLFLESCVAVYAVGGPEQGPFLSKFFNVIDPLRTSNNLGRSVSKGNFFRIRSAFGFGAKRLARLLDCPKEDIITEVNQFFTNTWERHGTGHRPDAPTASLLRLHRLNFGHHNMPENRRNQLSSNMNNENSTGRESEADGYHTFHETSYRHGSEGTARTSSMPSVSHKQGQKNYGNGTGSKVSDPVAWNVNSSQRVNNEKAQEIPKPGYLVKDGHDKYQFVRTRSSPELLNNSAEISSRGRRHRALDTGKTHIDSVRSDNSSRKKNSSSEFPYSNNTRSSINDPSSVRHIPSHQGFDTSNNSNSASNYYHDEAGLNTLGEELSSLNETMERHQEQQDLVNMMASSGLHGFNAQVQMPMNIGTSRLPFPISPSVLASMAYAQRNMPGMIPGSIPLVDPHWGTNIQFPQGMVPSSLSHYFPSMRLTSNPEDMIDSRSVNQELTVSQEHSDQDIWNEDGVASTRDFSDVNGSTHTRQFDDKQYSAATGHNFVSSSRNSSGSSSTRNQHSSDKESRRLLRDGLVREDLDDTIHHKKNRGSEGHSTERISNLRSLTTSHTSSSRSRASSESSWDESSVKVSKSTRDKRGRKPAPSTPTVFGENKSGSQYERVSIDHGSPRADDGIRDWIPLSTMGSEMAGPNTAGSSHSRSQQLPNYESAQMSVSESLLPIAPMVLGSGSRQAPLDNSRVLPFTFFPTGPPVPFLTMLPVYNFATNTGNSDGSSNHFDKEEEETDSSHMYQSEQNIDSAECLDQLENLSINSMKNGALSEHLEEQKHDILDSDFSSHWQNLQYGRFCQNPRHHGPLFYHSPVMVPPMYLQGNFQWDGPGRPNSSNGNLVNQVMGYGHRLVPVTPLQPSSSRPAGVYQRYGDEMPRYRGGTGTYLPNTKVTFRDRQSSSSRNQRGNYNYDHNDHVADRDGNWNNPKPRYSGRHYNRTQSEKGSSRSDRLATNDNRANRSWEPYRHESFPAHHSQNGSIGSSASVHNGPANGVHGVYSSQAVNSNGIAPSGTGAPPVLMLYSYDPNGGFGSNAEQVEFGSLHRPHLSGVSEIPQHGEGYIGRGAHGQQRFRGNSALSSPDQPSSPQFQRGI